jgi:hypothetical protein
MISLDSVCYGDSWVTKHFLSPQHLIPSGWRQPEFHWLLPPQVWFFFLATLRHLQWSALFSLHCMTTQLQKPNATKIWMSSSDSKTDLKLQCDYYIKFQLFEGAQDVFSRLMAVCCMLLPHNPYRLPQHYKRQIYGLSCSCKHLLLWISQIFVHQFCLKCTGTVHHWPLSSTNSVGFICQCWYFNPQWTPVQAINKASSVWTILVSWDKMHNYYALTYIYIMVCGGV